MGKILFILFVTILGISAYANDSIYGGFNPASRCDNPAGLENPIGVKKQICREMLANTGIYACIRPREVMVEEQVPAQDESQTQAQVKAPVPQPVRPHTCLKVRERIVVVSKGKAEQDQKQGQMPDQLQVPRYCDEYPTLTDDLDASLIDSTINYRKSNNEYLRGITLGEYRAACEDLQLRGAL